MVLSAATAKVGLYVFEDGRILKLLKKKELHSGNKGKSAYQYLVSDCKSGHHSTRHWSHDHTLRQVEPTVEKYMIMGLGDHTNVNPKHPERTRLYLSLAKEPIMSIREDVYVKDPGLIQYLKAYYAPTEGEDDPEPLHLQLNSFTIDPLHRVDKEVTLEQVTSVDGYDMSHLHDHHHGHHHEHKVLASWV